MKDLNDIIAAAKIEARRPLNYDIAGHQITIGAPDLSFFLKMQAYPPRVKAELMGISIEDMQKMIFVDNLELQETCIKLLSKKWYWRETGDPVRPMDSYTCNILFGIKTSKAFIVRALKRNGLSREEMLKIREVLTDGISVYSEE